LPKFLFLLALLATCEAQAQAPPIGQGGAAPGPPLVFRGSHAVVGGPSPRIDPTQGPGCGTDSAVAGSDVAGSIAFGSTSDPTMACVIRFAMPWQSFPVFCQVQPLAASGLDLPPTATFTWLASTQLLYFKGFAIGGLAIWQCFGSP
jgi:hypothetical protein